MNMTSHLVIGDGKTASEALGDLLTRYRVERKLSRSEVADRVGATSSRVDDFEKGKSVPEPRVWARYCNMIAKGLRGHVDIWKAAVAERSTPAKAQDAATAAAGFAVSEPVDAEAVATVHAEPLPSVADAKTFGEALSRARKISGLTQAELGELCNVTAGAVGAWENLGIMPVQANMAKLVSVYPELETWRSRSRDIPQPLGNLGGTRAVEVPTPAVIAAQPLRASIGDMLTMALANTDSVAALPKPSIHRHDAYYTEIGGSRPEISTAVMERLTDGDDGDVEIPDAPVPVPALAIVPAPAAEPTYEELLERQRVAAIARLNAVRDAAKAKKALAAAQQEVARVQRIQAEAEAEAIEANEAVERYVSAIEDDAGA